jgi:hypothetical protein
LYVKQPPGFEDPNFPNHVYKLNKALYFFYHENRRGALYGIFSI